MPGPVYLQLASGARVTSAFTVDKPCNMLVVEIPSFSASTVYAQFTQSSGSGPFSTPFRADGSGLQHVVYSSQGGGWGYVTHPTNFGRLLVTSGPATSTVTFTVLPR